MHKSYRNTTTFKMECENDRYVIPVGLKNTCFMYQRMTYIIYKKETNEVLEIYMDDMIVKSNKKEMHDKHFISVSNQVQKYKMKLNPDKCTFDVRTDKFL